MHHHHRAPRVTMVCINHVLNSQYSIWWMWRFVLLVCIKCWNFCVWIIAMGRKLISWVYRTTAQLHFKRKYVPNSTTSYVKLSLREFFKIKNRWMFLAWEMHHHHTLHAPNYHPLSLIYADVYKQTTFNNFLVSDKVQNN